MSDIPYELLALMQQAGLVGDPEITKMIEIYLVTHDKHLYKTIKDLLMIKASSIIASQDTFIPYPPADVIQGPVAIGKVVPTGAAVGIFLAELNRGMLICGSPGSGKTNLIELMAPQVAALGIKIFIVDVKQDYLSLLSAIPDLVILDLQTLRFNPLEVPKGADPNRHAQLVSSVYRKSTGVVIAGESTFYQGLLNLYEKYGVFENKDVFPSLIDLWKAEESNKEKPFSDRGRARNREVMRLETVCKACGDSINCSTGISCESILNSNVLLLVDRLNPDVRSFLVGCILISLIEFRMAKGERGMGLLNWLCIDEGKSLMPVQEERQINQGVPTFTEFLLGSRDFGFGSCVTDHMPTFLGAGIKAGSHIKLILNLSRGQDLEDMAKSMGLSRDQLQQSFHLGEHQGILKLGGGRWSYPVRVELQPSGLDRTISLDEAKRRCQAAVDHVQESVTPRVPLPQQAEIKLEAEMDVFLKHVHEHPLLPMKERLAQVNLGKRKAYLVKERLIAEGYINTIFVRPGPGRPIALLELLQKGRERLVQMGVKVQGDRGSLRHSFWVEQARQFFTTEGFNVEKEAPLAAVSGIVFPDLLLLNAKGKRIAVEVELSDHGLKNIFKLLPVVDEIFLVIEDERLREKLLREARESLSNEDFNRLKFFRTQELIPHKG